MSIDTIITAVRAHLVDCKSDTPLVRLEDLERENGLDFLDARRLCLEHPAELRAAGLSFDAQRSWVLA